MVDAKLLEYLRTAPHRLYEVPPRAFETIIAEIFDGLGFTLKQQKQTRDEGVDIVAIRKDVANEMFLIQCKRNKREKRVSVDVVNALLGVVHSRRATKGIVVTTSYFTKPSKKFIEENEWQLEGKDFDDLVLWLQEYQRRQMEKIVANSA